MSQESLSAMEATRARIHAQAAAARTRRDTLAELAASVDQTVATVRSPRGEVTVTASASALVQKVELQPTALDLDAVALGRIVTETIERAQRAAAHLAVEKTAQALGADNPVVTAIADDVSRRFGPDDTLQPGEIRPL